MSVRRIVRRLLPPIMYDAVRRIRRSDQSPVPSNGATYAPPDWEYLPDGVEPPQGSESAWMDQSVVDEQLRKWKTFVALTSGNQPLGIAHEAPEPSTDDLCAHNIVMSFGYVLALSASGKNRLSMLDWGSGLGHYYLFSRALLPEVEIDYHGRDIPLLCRAGREVLAEASFHETDEPCFQQRYDLIVVSGSLQYADDWRMVMKRFTEVADRFIYLVVPVVSSSRPYRTIQRAHRYGYLTEFVGWVYNRQEIVDHMDIHGFRLRREFLNEMMAVIPGVPERGATTGFLFERRD